jgi:hypothetical protein
MQTLIVDLLVLVAAIYVAWKFTPAPIREKIAPKLAAIASRLHLPQSLVRRLEQKVASAGGCGSCNSCNACATDPSTAPDANASAMHVIPIKLKR